jgi:hypothetical protein
MRNASNSFIGDFPPDTTRLASPRAAMAAFRLAAI